MSFAATRENYLVIDKNALRAHAAAAAKAEADSQGLGVLVIDTTFKEIARGGNWPRHYMDDFRDWTDRPDRMSVSWGSGELIREERISGGAATTVVDMPMTNTHRRLLTALATGDTATLVAATPRVAAEAARITGVGGELNALDRLNTMRTLTETWWSTGPRSVKKAIIEEWNDSSKGPLASLGEIVMTATALRKPLEHALQQNGFSHENAASVLSKPTFTNFLHSAYEAYSLILWAQGDRLVNTNADSFLNQMIDLNYIAYGLCCTELITHEQLIHRLAGGLRAACQKLWP